MRPPTETEIEYIESVREERNPTETEIEYIESVREERNKGELGNLQLIVKEKMPEEMPSYLKHYVYFYPEYRLEIIEIEIDGVSRIKNQLIPMAGRDSKEEIVREIRDFLTVDEMYFEGEWSESDLLAYSI